MYPHYITCMPAQGHLITASCSRNLNLFPSRDGLNTIGAFVCDSLFSLKIKHTAFDNKNQPAIYPTMGGKYIISSGCILLLPDMRGNGISLLRLSISSIIFFSPGRLCHSLPRYSPVSREASMERAAPPAITGALYSPSNLYNILSSERTLGFVVK
jgi:hypothetical protein